MRQSVFAGLFATGALAFAPAPVRWAADPTKNFVIVPEGFPFLNNAPDGSQLLTVVNEASTMPHGEIPRFMIRPDSTIGMDSMHGCMEASGSKVRINHCTGGASQRWSWLPNGNGRTSWIQLQGTSQCLDVNEKAGDLNGAPIELKECDSRLSESWQFHESALAAPRESPTFMRSLIISSAAVATLVMLSLGAGLWRKHTAHDVAMQQGGTPLNIEDGGVSLAPVFECGAQGMTPAVMAVPSKEEEPEKEKDENPIQQIKKFGVAGVISYALWEGGFWTVGGAGGILAYFLAFGHWPDFSNADDSAKVGAEAFAFINIARFAVPLRIGLAVGTAPWVDENIVRRFGLGKGGDNSEGVNFADDFEVIDEDGTEIKDLGANTALLNGLTTAPLSDGFNFQTKKTFDTVVDGKRHLGIEWIFEVDSVHVKGRDVEQLKAKYGFPLRIAGSSSFNYDENGKVKSMKIGSWRVNGDKIDFPIVADSGVHGPSIKGWAEGMLGLVEDGVAVNA